METFVISPFGEVNGYIERKCKINILLVTSLDVLVNVDLLISSGGNRFLAFRGCGTDSRVFLGIVAKVSQKNFLNTESTDYTEKAFRHGSLF